MDDTFPWKFLISIVTGCILAGIALGMYGCPKYDVYKQTLQGEAELKRAEANRRIRVFEAQAELDSAKLKAEAEIERARGVAQANEIIAERLKGHEEYLRWLWIEKVAGSANREIVYVPTEANLPVLEATRLAPLPAGGH